MKPMVPAHIEGQLVDLVLVDADRDTYRVLTAMDPRAAMNLQFFAERHGALPAEAEEHTYLARMEASPTDFLYLVVRRDNQQIIGTIGLHEHDPHHRTARFGVLIFQPATRGKGYGAEAVRLLLHVAFEELGVHKVYGQVFVENIRGRTFYAKLGFVTEAILRDVYLKDGVYHSMAYISMLASEFATLTTGKEATHG